MKIKKQKVVKEKKQVVEIRIYVHQVNPNGVGQYTPPVPFPNQVPNSIHLC